MFRDLPQVAEMQIPQPMDAAGEFASYTDKEQGKGEIMPKKSDANKAGKSHKSHSPKQGRGERPDKAGGQQKKDREIKPGGQQKKNREIKPAASNDKAFDGIEKLSGGKKSKDGCLPKVFVLLLPFAGVGAYLFLHS
ncbi:MAG: hypothetical protein Q8L87_01415 [Anaerolineales bacterium]|nr:hypothetical protein [Anaerolineales bacterium]